MGTQLWVSCLIAFVCLCPYSGSSGLCWQMCFEMFKAFCVLRAAHGAACCHSLLAWPTWQSNSTCIRKPEVVRFCHVHNVLFEFLSQPTLLSQCPVWRQACSPLVSARAPTQHIPLAFHSQKHLSIEDLAFAICSRLKDFVCTLCKSLIGQDSSL